jgi:hypothetical protein
MEERRAKPRRRVLKKGLIDFDYAAGIGCTVRNLSDDGACIEIEGQMAVPNSFCLTIDGEMSGRAARVVWRAGRRIGLAFSKAPESQS